MCDTIRFIRPSMIALSLSSLLMSGVTMQSVVAQDQPAFEHIRFDDLAISLPFHIAWSWNAIGADLDDNIYVVFGGHKGDSADCALFQYQAKTGKCRLLGTLSDAAEAADNLHSGEPIEKGHTRLPYLDGKIYIGTMGFHNAMGVKAHSLQTRGAHLMAYDVAADRIEDLSHDQPDGVFFKNRGFIAVETASDRGLVVAVTVPQGDLLIYDAARKKVLARKAGIPEELGRAVGREVVVAPNGKVYYCYAGERWGKGPGHMYVYDIASGCRQQNPIDIDASLWKGQTKSHDGKRIYVSTQRGDLFQLDYQNDKLVHLGSLYPEADRKEFQDDQFAYEIPAVLGITLSSDEQKIYCVPVRRRTPLQDLPKDGGKARGPRMLYGLCEFDIQRRETRKVREFPASESVGWLTGSNARDSLGNVYFARHGGGFCGLLKVRVGNVDEGDSGQTQ